MIADKACAERGCACHDPRFDGKGVELIRREWVGLTDEERVKLWNEWENGHVVEAVEAKLKEKNT